ncbi:MAG TPA: MFS transporter [Burkholderiales bacterium]|jgi:MFS family permease
MSAASRLTPVQLTLLMCGAEAFSMTGFAAYTTLLPTLQLEWGLSNSEAGLVSGVYYAGYVAATPILTSLTDRVDARRVYLAACLLSCAGAAGFWLFAGGLASALVFQFLIGAGLGGTYMPGLKMLADLLEGARQSRAVAFYTATFGIGSTLSILASGWVGASWGWQAAFAWGAVGPLAAGVIVSLAMPRGRTRPPGQPAPALLDFRPVLRNRRTLPYILGYSAHNYELFGQRSWMVAFLVFTASLQPADAPMWVGAATLAALINLLGPVMSISGNELALRFGRTRVIFTFMTASGLLACVLGYTAAAPWMLVFLIMCVHYGLMLGDSAALTAGAVAAAHPDERGATMATYSFVGFSSAFFAPLVFGAVLDLAGGNRSLLAWGLAFASIGIFGVLAPVARFIYARRG